MQFVKETPIHRIGAVTSHAKTKAKSVISKHARSWRLRQNRRNSPIGKALPRWTNAFAQLWAQGHFRLALKREIDPVCGHQESD